MSCKSDSQTEPEPLIIENFVEALPPDDVLAHAERDHTLAGLKFADYLVFFMSSPACHVIKTPQTLLMLIEHQVENRWHVHYAYNATALPPLDVFLSQMPHWHETLTWARPIKNRHPVLRTYSVRRLFQLSQLNPSLVPGYPGD